MTAYSAPLTEMRFVLQEVAGLPEVAGWPGYEEASADLVDAVLEEAGKLAGEVLAPINMAGDQAGCRFENGVVRTPPGFKEAYRHHVEGGWNGLAFEPEYGGQGLPWLLATPIQEMWNAANMSFALCPLLNQGAVELLQAHGTEEQKACFLPRMVSGEWAGTMNLTEPQAGSDVGAVKTRAQRDGAQYRITGQKIYITYGEHDFTENIVHMVLARLPDAPAGTKGISLFLVPKFLVSEDGTLGPRNDLRCASIEHKLGINASPTAVMAYGDNEGAIGYLVGEENDGMACMFTMMNNARLAVGVQGLAIAERAYQQAVAFARERVQSRALDGAGNGSVPIIRHPDVRRMLMTMKAETEAARALAYAAAAALDRSKRHPDPAERARGQAVTDLLIPVVKAWSTDLGCEVASLGVQVHGGMGYIEETGAAQHYRDARILPIYEGTNGIQALDLLMRKLARDEGRAAQAFLGEMEDWLAAMQSLPGEQLRHLRERLAAALGDLRAVTDSLLVQAKDDPARAAAGASPYLRLFGTVVGGLLLAKAAAAAARLLGNGSGKGFDPGFLEAKLATARFYADNVLPQASGLAAQVATGGGSVLALDEAQF